MTAEALEDELQKRQRVQHLPTPNEDVPERLELFPAGCVRDVPESIPRGTLGRCSSPDRRPAVEVAIGAAVAGLKLGRSQQGGTKDDVARVVQVRAAMNVPVFVLQLVA